MPEGAAVFVFVVNVSKPTTLGNPQLVWVQLAPARFPRIVRDSVPYCVWLRENIMLKFLKLIKNEEGATAIEYGLIAALIAVAAIGAMTSVGSKLNDTFTNVSSALEG